MKKTSVSAAESDDLGAPHRALSRRTVIAGTAWSVPVIVAMTATPTFAAASVQPRTIAVTTANMQVTASGTTQVKAQVKDGTVPVNAAPVSFSGPTGSSFAPASTTTDASGTATTMLTLNNPWTRPGSTTTVSAVSGSATASQGLTILGANLMAAGSGYTSSFAQDSLVFPSPIVQATSCDSYMGAQFVLLQDGSVWSKGRNGKGSLGDGSTSDRSAWAKIPSLSAVTQIAAGGESAYALLSDGTVRAWGANQSGQLGDGTQMDRSTPVTVLASSNTPLTGVTQITAGYSTAHALLNDGSVRSWGDNQYGQLATGNNNSSTFPVAAQVAFDPGTPGSGSSTPLTGVTQIAAGRYTIVARTTDGTVRAWGYNVDGAVGDGTFGQGLDRYRAVLVRIATPQDTTVTNPLKNVAAVAAGSFCMYAILTDKSVVAWGRNQSYALGTGQSGDRSAVAVPAPDLVDIVEVTGGREYGVARKTDGTILTWGANYSGQLGNGSMTTQTQPTAVTNQQLLGQKVVTLGISTLAFAVFLITA